MPHHNKEIASALEYASGKGWRIVEGEHLESCQANSTHSR